MNKLHVDSVEHFSGEAKYILSNITVELDYLDAKQKIEVVESDEVEVSGGMFDFLFNFNFTKGPISGYGHGNYALTQARLFQIVSSMSKLWFLALVVILNGHLLPIPNVAMRMLPSQKLISKLKELNRSMNKIQKF